MNIFKTVASLAIFTITSIQALTIATPTTANFPSGEIISLKVTLQNTDLQTTLTYSAVFSCAAGAYQLSDLVIGTTYSVIPPGVFGPVTLTVTAVGCATALMSLTITPPVPNNPPVYVPVQLPRLSYPFPALYAHFNENGKAEIDAVAFFNSEEEAVECGVDSKCVEKYIKLLN